MVQRIIKLTEQDIKEIVKRSLNEITRSEFENIDGPMPNPKHTERAFAVGDVLARYRRTYARDNEGNHIIDANGKKQTVGQNQFSTIIGIENGVLKLDDGTKFNPKGECCTDIWYKIISQFGGDSSSFSFDYETIDGELWLVVDIRFGLTSKSKYRFKRSDIKNSGLGQTVKGVKMDASEHVAKTGFWLKEGDTIPVRSKNPMPDRQPVPKEFICYKKTGSSFGGKNELFGSWNFEEAKNICTEYRWLYTTPAQWSLPISGGDINNENRILKKSQCTPKEFSQWLQTQTEEPAFIEYVKNRKR